MSAGLHFGYANKIYFKIKDIEDVVVKIFVGENQVDSVCIGSASASVYVGSEEVL